MRQDVLVRVLLLTIDYLSLPLLPDYRGRGAGPGPRPTWGVLKRGGFGVGLLGRSNTSLIMENQIDAIVKEEKEV